MTNLIAYLQSHSLIVLGAYYVFSAAISAMPSPNPDSGNGYKWLYQFGNTLAGNLSRAFATKLPIVPSLEGK